MCENEKSGMSTMPDNNDLLLASLNKILIKLHNVHTLGYTLGKHK